ncbi:MAG: 5,10-methylenetetrahydrofolate reductase [Candidatus Thorarchaeota archaeon]|nr:5,10-methylenetetrahydrofolate reductase [Candidatus Thorarchaeota archaeon]
MIVMSLKSMAQILDMLKGYEKVVLFGDSGCAQLCDVGGILQLESMEDLLTKHGMKVLGYIFVEGGLCDIHAVKLELDRHVDMLKDADAFLIQACGVATQAITDLIPEKESFPAVDTTFLGVMPERFVHHETCVMCGECVLHLTGGICPIARCAKEMLNGPCGGSMDGKCERDEDTECVWQLIYDRLKSLGKLNNIKKIWEIRDHSLTHSPRSITHEGF